MIQSQYFQGKMALRRRVYSILIVAVLAMTVSVNSIVLSAESESGSKKALLKNEPWIGDFDKMTEKRQIRVLVTYSKTFYFLDRGQQRGLTYDLLEEFEKYVNQKFKAKTLKINVVYIPVRRDELIPGLEKGLGDIAVANLTITSQRRKHVDFSNPLMTGVQEVLVTGPSASTVVNLDDLAGKQIHVRKSSSYYESLVELNASQKKNGKKPIKLIPADDSLEDEDLLEMVNAGLIPMIIMDSHKAQFWTQIFDKIQVHSEISVRTGGEIAWAFRKNSPKLKAVINKFVASHKEGTLIGNMLFKRYLKNTKYVKNSLSKKELKKFEDMVKLFKKYASRYDFDYLMITAQAYQESGLDHSKTSPAGAIGVMQLLPATAADPNVNIPDIEKLENNIHAGTKYLRFIINQYYQDEGMDNVNKLLFAFASYNAGPAKVDRLRKETAAMGLDPNVWFHNAEIAAAKIIGRETVQYVSNIYKYYIAYRMTTKQRERKQKILEKKAA
ncbi:MAG: lytic transglycosylase F [Desulfobacterales bacterium]